MKLLLFMSILLFSFSAHGKEPGATEAYWICHQVGVMPSTKKGVNDNTLAITNIHTDEYKDNYAARMFQFHQQVKTETKGKFTGQFEPKCVSFDDSKKAIQFRERGILRAKHNNYHILNIEFRYDPDKPEQQKQMPLY